MMSLKSDVFNGQLIFFVEARQQLFRPIALVQCQHGSPPPVAAEPRSPKAAEAEAAPKASEPKAASEPGPPLAAINDHMSVGLMLVLI